MGRALDKLKATLEAKFNKGDYKSIMWASEIPVRDRVPSGSLALDFALGGGMPSDRCVELAGVPGAGKTTLALHTLMNFLDKFPDRGALFLDSEHKLTEAWMSDLIGRERMERVILAWPDHIEQATDMYMEAVGSGEISIVVLDSIGGSATIRVTEKSAEKGNIGGNALGVTRFATLAQTYSQKYNCLTLGLNQTREDMDGFNRHLTPGGNAWKHACIARIALKVGQNKVFDKVNGEELQVGYEVKAKIVKNQMAAPGRTAWWYFYNVATEKYGFGIDTLDEIARLSLLTGVVEQTGGGYYNHPSIPGGKVRGRDGFVALVKESNILREVIVKDVMKALEGDKELIAQIAPVDLTDEEGIPLDTTPGNNIFGNTNGI